MLTSELLTPVSLATCGASITAPSPVVISGLYLGSPTGPGVATVGGKPFLLGTTCGLWLKSTVPGNTSPAAPGWTVWTAFVPSALASLGAAFPPYLLASAAVEASVTM